MLLTTQAIMLHATRYGDTSYILHLFTQEAGIVSCMMRRNKKAMAGLQPLSLLDVVLDTKPTRSLSYLRSYNSLAGTPEATDKSPTPLKIDCSEASCPYGEYLSMTRISMKLFLAEFLNHALSGENTNKPLYDFLKNSLIVLHTQERGIANFHIVFLLHFAHYIGIRPLTDDYTQGQWFDMQDSRFSPKQPSHPDVLSPAMSEHFNRLLRMRYDTMHRFAMTAAERNLCVDYLLHYYRLHLPSLPELKSLPILRELFR